MTLLIKFFKAKIQTAIQKFLRLSWCSLTAILSVPISSRSGEGVIASTTSGCVMTATAQAAYSGLCSE